MSGNSSYLYKRQWKTNINFSISIMALFERSGKSLKKGDLIPSFTLKDQNGNPVDIPEALGENGGVIYFYPKDDSPVCTRQARAFRDHYEAFTDAGVRVIGINSGSTESHKEFQQKYDLPFTLLSDPDNEVLRQFGIKNVLFLTGRETFIINAKGRVVHKFRDLVNAGNHIEEALGALKLL